jgi:phage FluMu gp28-like protein
VTVIEYARPWLYPAQRRAIFDAPDVNGNPARYALIEASTKAGKTSACIAWLVEQAVQGKPGDNYWWVAPIYGQAKIAYRRMKRGLPASLFRANESELTITLINGVVIWFKSADNPDALYGDDVRAAVLDEASRMKEESWVAIRSTVTATQGPLRIIGNVKGRLNWFYRMARRAEAGEPGLAYAKLTALDAIAGGVLKASEIEDARRQLPENVFRELYMAEASDDSGNPFGQDHIRACVAPLSEKAPVACGVDLAKSVDWTVVVALDRAATVCGFERWQRVPWAETSSRVLGLIGRTPSLIDSTGVGDPVVEGMQREGRNARIEGFTFSGPSKQRLMEGLAVAIQSGAVRYPDGAIRAELDSFEYAYTRTGVRYTAPAGYHDDCVMALALAVQKHAAVRPWLASALPSVVSRTSPWRGTEMQQQEA